MCVVGGGERVSYINASLLIHQGHSSKVHLHLHFLTVPSTSKLIRPATEESRAVKPFLSFPSFLALLSHPPAQAPGDGFPSKCPVPESSSQTPLFREAKTRLIYKLIYSHLHPFHFNLAVRKNPFPEEVPSVQTAMKVAYFL